MEMRRHSDVSLRESGGPCDSQWARLPPHWSAVEEANSGASPNLLCDPGRVT